MKSAVAGLIPKEKLELLRNEALLALDNGWLSSFAAKAVLMYLSQTRLLHLEESLCD
jgi:hypothetical protein